jgi:uncharacterized protein
MLPDETPAGLALWGKLGLVTVALMTELAAERYVSITTFRRDGTAVATPVWIVGSAGLLYVWTGPQTGKARRIRNNPEVLLAPCTMRGVVTGPAVAATAAVVAVGDRPEIWRLIVAKYRLQVQAIVWSGRITRLLRRQWRGAGERTYLELTVGPPLSAAR